MNDSKSESPGNQRFAVKVLLNNCDSRFLKSNSRTMALTVKDAGLKLAHNTRGFR